jgi:succinate dehydrogenase / fumarate reductase, cytochrome b subunit
MPGRPDYFSPRPRVFLRICLTFMNALTRSLSAFWTSSIGKKYIVAVSGVILVGFLAGHLAGNLLVFAGPDIFNEYALFLHSAAHGSAVWVARAVLLGALVAHVLATISLVKHNRAARSNYEFEGTIQASRASRTMIWSGLTILAFVIYHLLHFTFRAGNDYGSYVDRHGNPNAWRMVIEGFSWFPAVAFYVIAISLLCTHLSHGVSSMFQTLGWRSKRSASLIDKGAKVYSLIIWLGFLSIPLAIYLFKFGR